MGVKISGSLFAEHRCLNCKLGDSPPPPNKPKKHLNKLFFLFIIILLKNGPIPKHLQLCLENLGFAWKVCVFECIISGSWSMKWFTKGTKSIYILIVIICSLLIMLIIHPLKPGLPWTYKKDFDPKVPASDLCCSMASLFWMHSLKFVVKFSGFFFCVWLVKICKAIEKQ